FELEARKKDVEARDDPRIKSGDGHDAVIRLHRNALSMTTADPKSASPIPRLLTGQKALVTGANSGIGQAVAIALGQAGADVVVNYVAAEDRAQEVVHAIAQHGVKAYAHLADVSDETQVRDMFSTMVQRLGTIDILVNNAGLQRDAPFEEMTL